MISPNFCKMNRRDTHTRCTTRFFLINNLSLLITSPSPLKGTSHSVWWILLERLHKLLIRLTKTSRVPKCLKSGGKPATLSTRIIKICSVFSSLISRRQCSFNFFCGRAAKFQLSIQTFDTLTEFYHLFFTSFCTKYREQTMFRSSIFGIICSCVPVLLLLLLLM